MWRRWVRWWRRWWHSESLNHRVSLSCAFYAVAGCYRVERTQQSKEKWEKKRNYARGNNEWFWNILRSENMIEINFTLGYVIATASCVVVGSKMSPFLIKWNKMVRRKFQFSLLSDPCNMNNIIQLVSDWSQRSTFISIIMLCNLLIELIFRITARVAVTQYTTYCYDFSSSSCLARTL